MVQVWCAVMHCHGYVESVDGVLCSVCGASKTKRLLKVYRIVPPLLLLASLSAQATECPDMYLAKREPMLIAPLAGNFFELRNSEYAVLVSEINKTALYSAEKLTPAQVKGAKRITSLPPSQIVPRLADQRRYLASESSFYRILRAADQQHRRGRSQPPRHVPVPTSHTATGPNQVWSWDITYLPSLVRGQYYYLYLIEDIYSRKGVSWEVHEQECGERAAALLQRSIIREQCWKQPLVLHSDNGAPMKSVTLLTKMHDLGVTPSRGRPRVSNDNPYSESLFRTLKYCPQWPSDGFASLEAAREWVRDFMAWYNEEHRHSRIRFVTPNERHRGDDKALLAKRDAVYQAARAQHPARWSGKTRDWTPIGAVMLNPERPEKPEPEQKEAA